MRRSAKTLLLALGAIGFAAAGAHATEEPFSVGERLTYTLKWGIVTAGTAVLQVNPMAEIDGEEVYHFTLTVETTPFVDRFYKVRDRIDGFARADMNGSVLYLLKKEEGKNLRDVRVTYDRAAEMAQYRNFDQERDPVRIFPGTFDPLSVVYAFRTLPLDRNSVMEIPISDGRRAAMGTGRVGKPERVRVPAGNFRTILVEPDMQDVGGVFDKSGDAPLRIWFSEDERRLPVRLSSRVSVGSFRADLVSIEEVPVEQRVALGK
jgi:hypothetical protein